MPKEVYETWETSQKDLSVLFYLKFRQEVLGRKLLPAELIEFALFMEDFLSKAEGLESEKPMSMPFAELNMMLDDELKLFQGDILKTRKEEGIKF